MTVGWTGGLTSLNAVSDRTGANAEIAAATRAGFGSTADGEFTPDESFGTVTIVSEDPFTVRYDLAEPAWSDGIPLDAADLVLGWIAAVGGLAEDAALDGLTPPKIDEFARSIDVRFAGPRSDWQSFVTVPVPAHIVGKRAFGLDDPMEAKQAVITAIRGMDAAALTEVGTVWRDGFDLAEGSDVPAELLLSSGPYLITEVAAEEQGQRITLAPNPEFAGTAMPQVERITLTAPGEDPVAAVGESLDVATVAPTEANRAPITERERRDFAVQATHDGTVWALLLRPAGVFSSAAARAAFLRAVPAGEMVTAGAGEWESAYTKTTSMLAAPGSRAFDVVTADSGFAAALGTPADEPAQDRAKAGVRSGARVCVLYDERSAFAKGAFAALREPVKEGGWSVADCGADDFGAARDAGRWDAVIQRVSVPSTPAEIAAQWGTDGSASVIGNADAARDELIATLAQTVDVYAAREIRAEIEASIVRAAVARPLAMAPRVTIVAPGVTGVTPRDGAVAPILSGISQWVAAP